MYYYDLGDGRDWRAAPIAEACEAFEAWTAGDRQLVALAVAWLTERHGDPATIGGYWVNSRSYFRLIDPSEQKGIGQFHHGYLWIDDPDLPFGRLSNDARHRFVQLDGFSPREMGSKVADDVPQYCPACSARGRTIALPVSGICDDHGRIIAPWPAPQSVRANAAKGTALARNDSDWSTLSVSRRESARGRTHVPPGARHAATPARCRSSPRRAGLSTR